MHPRDARGYMPTNRRRSFPRKFRARSVIMNKLLPLLVIAVFVANVPVSAQPPQGMGSAPQSSGTSPSSGDPSSSATAPSSGGALIRHCAFVRRCLLVGHRAVRSGAPSRRKEHGRRFPGKKSDLAVCHIRGPGREGQPLHSLGLDGRLRRPQDKSRMHRKPAQRQDLHEGHLQREDDERRRMGGHLLAEPGQQLGRQAGAASI